MSATPRRRRWLRDMGLPLVGAELRRESRRIRGHLLRWGYLFGLLLLYILIRLLAWDAGGGAGIATGAFAAIVWIQALCLFFASIHTASLLMSEERSRMTLEVLLTTPISSRGLLLGKWLSVLSRAAVMVLGALPAVALLMTEGGIAPVQVIGAGVLTLAGCMWGAALVLLGASLSPKRHAGAGFAIAVLLLYFALLGLVHALPHILDEIYPGVDWSHLELSPFASLVTNPFLSLALFAHGPGWWSAAASLWTVAGLYLGAALAGSYFLLTFASFLLRPLAALGKLPIRVALWRAVFGRAVPKDPPRRRWERGPCRPWRSALLWRALAWRASPRVRRRRFIVTLVLGLALLFGPFVYFVLETTSQQTLYLVDALVHGNPIPAPPEDPIWTGGFLLPDPDTYQLKPVRHGRYDWLYRDRYDSWEILQGWTAFLGAIVAFGLPIVLGSAIASAVAKEREKKRLDVLLSVPLAGRALARGFLAEGVRPWLGLYVAVALATLLLCFTGLQALLLVAGAVTYLLVMAVFCIGAGLRFGLKAKSVRHAQGRYGGLLLFLLLVWPMITGGLSLILVIVDFVTNKSSESLMMILNALSPAAILFYLFAGLVEDGPPESERSLMMSAGTTGLLVYLCVGLWLLILTTRRLRDLAARGG